MRDNTANRGASYVIVVGMIILGVAVARAWSR